MIEINHVRIIEGDLSLPNHQRALVELTNAYLNDTMGEKRRFPANIKRRLVAGLMKQPAALIFFAEYSDKIIGLATCFLGFSTFYAKKLVNIHDLIVLPGYRRRGVAEKILSFIEGKAKKMECCKLTLEVRKDNITAMRLYKKRGFDSGKHPMCFWTKTL